MNHCEGSGLTCLHALGAVAAGEAAAAEAHIASCPACRTEFEDIGCLVERFVFWPVDVLRPARSLEIRLARRVNGEALPVLPPIARWPEPEWDQVAAGIECKLLSTDARRHRVSMLVRLKQGAKYPAHIHAGVEELHLLDGELWIDGRALFPGDYYYGASGTSDTHVWSETGCTCFLACSTENILR